MNQMIGYNAEKEATERKMSAWTLGLREAVRGLQANCENLASLTKSEKKQKCH